MEGRYQNKADVPAPPDNNIDYRVEIERLKRAIHDSEVWVRLTSSPHWAEVSAVWQRYAAEVRKINQSLSPFADSRTAGRIERNNGKLDMLDAFFAVPTKSVENAKVNKASWITRLHLLLEKVTSLRG